MQASQRDGFAASSKPLSTGWFYTLLIGHLIAIVLIPFFLFEAAITSWGQGFLDSEPATWLVAVLVVAALTFDVLLPIPASLVSLAAAVLIGGVAGWTVLFAGLMCSSLFGYWVGMVADDVLLDRLVSRRNKKRMHLMRTRWGHATIILMRPVPVMAEVTAILAGVDRVNFPVYCVLCLVANAGVATIYLTLAG